MVTLKPTTPLLAPNKGLLKPASPLHPKNAPKTPISRPQRRWWFQPHTDSSKQRRWRFQSRLGRRPQRRWWFQTGPPGRQGQTAVPMGGGRAWPDNEAMRQDRPQHTRHRGCGGCRRDGGPGCGAGGRRRGLAGLRPNAPNHTSVHQAPPVWRAPEGPEGTGGLRDRPLRAVGSRVAISRAAGPDGARNTSGVTSNNTRRGRLAGGPPPTGTHSGRALRCPEHPWGHNKTRPRPVSRPRPRHAHAAPFTTAPAIRRSCPRDPRPRRDQPRGGRRGRGTASRTRSPGPRYGRSGWTAGGHRARHRRRA